MSTAGSGPDRPGGAGGADATAAARVPAARYTPELPAPAEQPLLPRRKTRIVRWRGLIPLAIALGVIAIFYWLFADPIARSTFVDAASDALGTEVDLASLHIDTRHTAVDMAGLQIADPFDPRRNLLDIARIRVVVEPVPALHRSVVVRSLAIEGVRVGRPRTTPARPVKGNGFAPQAMAAVRRWRQSLDVPLLHLAPVDSIKAVAVDPTKLSAVRAALGVRDRADSVQKALRDGYAALELDVTFDSARVLTTRLAAADPRALGLNGMRQAVADVKRTVAAIDDAKKRVEALQQGVKNGAALLDDNVRSLDDSADADFARARAMLKLPTVGGPDLGAALFGKVTIDQLQRAVYWSELAEKYVPPGLKPRPEPGPKRLRAAGTTVHFVHQGALPEFWLQRGLVTLRLDEGVAKGDYRLSLGDVTTDPALIGRPTVAVLQRTSSDGIGLRAVALLDRRGGRVRDSAAVELARVPLPGFEIPATPFRLEPGAGISKLSFARDGERIAGGWSLDANTVRWVADSARIRSANTIEKLVYQVIGGLTAVQVAANISGTLIAPRVAIRSNLDRAIADQLRNVVGAQVEQAEARLRAEVDKQVQARVGPVKQRAADVRTEAEKRIADARAQLDQARQKLEDQRKQLEDRLRKGVLGGIGG